MSVPDISGKAIANLEIESLRHVAPTFHGDTLYGETDGARQVGVEVQGRPRRRARRDDRLQPGRHGGVHLPAQGDGAQAAATSTRAAASSPAARCRSRTRTGRVPTSRSDMARPKVLRSGWSATARPSGAGPAGTPRPPTSTLTDDGVRGRAHAARPVGRRDFDLVLTSPAQRARGPPSWPASPTRRSTTTSPSGPTATTRASPPPRSARRSPAGRSGPHPTPGRRDRRAGHRAARPGRRPGPRRPTACWSSATATPCGRSTARWIEQPVTEGRFFHLDTATVSGLGYDRDSRSSAAGTADTPIRHGWSRGPEVPGA